MPSGFDYYVFQQRGDLAIADPDEEQRCPYPKVTLVDSPMFKAAVDLIWERYALNKVRGIGDNTSANAFNVQRILSGTLPSARICAYHLGRGMAASVLEVLTGFPGDDYAPLTEPLSELIERITKPASPSFVMNAQDWLGQFISAGADGGSRAFSDLWNKTNPLAETKKKTWWRQR